MRHHYPNCPSQSSKNRRPFIKVNMAYMIIWTIHLTNHLRCTGRPVATISGIQGAFLIARIPSRWFTRFIHRQPSFYRLLVLWRIIRFNYRHHPLDSQALGSSRILEIEDFACCLQRQFISKEYHVTQFPWLSRTNVVQIWQISGDIL